MSRNDQRELLKAKTYVYRLLNIRLRSEHEIHDKLAKRGFSSDVIDQVVFYFKDIGLIDDHIFAQKWIESRLKKPYGAGRIKLELRKKGIHDSIIQDELRKATEEVSEEDIVFQLAIQRMAKYQALDETKAKQRIYGYLSRRGFSGQAIYKTLKKL